jgi:two-component system sensor histidine kinase DegS
MTIERNVCDTADAAALAAQRDRLEAALKLAERERQLLGFEIHDGVVQDLAAAAMLLEGAVREASFASSEARENYETGLRLLREGIAVARRLIGGTSAVSFDEQPLVPAIERLIEKFRSDHRLPVGFVRPNRDWRLPSVMQHLLLRVVHEALYNAWKHARASEVEVELRERDERLELTIRDNGAGFDPARAAAGRFGLEGMRERARLLNADLLFDTAPEHGTRIIIRLPLSQTMT